MAANDKHTWPVLLKTTPRINIVYWLAAFVITACVVCLPVKNPLSWDVFGYYLYLPLSLHYHDLTLQHYSVIQDIIGTYHNTDTFYQALKCDNGNWVMKYTMGLSWLYAPFYVIGYVVARLSHDATDGFSRPFQLSILYGCLVYTLFGLYAFKKVLQHFFEDRIAAITFVLVVFGTNYFFHMSLHGQGTMSHNMLFGLYSILLWYTIRWQQQQKAIYAIIIGICVGLAALIRPSEIIALLIPLLYGVRDLPSFRAKIKLLYYHKWQVLVMVTVIAAIGSCQLVYWKIATGKFLFDSYSASNPGEGFEFLHPFIAEVLFSFRKGWFVYTPVMLPAVAGLFMIRKWHSETGWMPLIYFLINLYIVGSWSCWWYAGSFSSRALIPSYAVMALPLGYVVSSVLKTRVKYIMGTVAGALLLLNLFQSWQVYAGILHPADMTRAYYLSTFGQISPPTGEQQKLLLVNRFTSIDESFSEEAGQEHQVSFSKYKLFPISTGKDTIAARISYLETGPAAPFSPVVKDQYHAITKKYYAWIKASCLFYTNQLPDSCNALLCVNMVHKNASFKFRGLPVAGKGFKAQTWNRMVFYYMTPELRTTTDSVNVFFWNMGPQKIWIDSLGFDALEPKQNKSVF